MTIMNDSKHHTLASLFLDKTILQTAFAPGDAHGNGGTASAVVKVNKGQHVYGFLHSGHLHSGNNHWSHFVGFLLQKCSLKSID